MSSFWSCFHYPPLQPFTIPPSSHIWCFWSPTPPRTLASRGKRPRPTVGAGTQLAETLLRTCEAGRKPPANVLGESDTPRRPHQRKWQVVLEQSGGPDGTSRNPWAETKEWFLGGPGLEIWRLRHGPPESLHLYYVYESRTEDQVSIFCMSDVHEPWKTLEDVHEKPSMSVDVHPCLPFTSTHRMGGGLPWQETGRAGHGGLLSAGRFSRTVGSDGTSPAWIGSLPRWRVGRAIFRLRSV